MATVSATQAVAKLRRPRLLAVSRGTQQFVRTNGRHVVVIRSHHTERASHGIYLDAVYRAHDSKVHIEGPDAQPLGQCWDGEQTEPDRRQMREDKLDRFNPGGTMAPTANVDQNS